MLPAADSFSPNRLPRIFPVANIKSAKKRAKQTVVRNERNVAQRSMLRTAVKKVIKALTPTMPKPPPPRSSPRSRCWIASPPAA